MTDRLDIYNRALRLCGERNLASLSEEREPRRALDDVFDGVVEFCLGEGDWNFAIRSIRMAESNATEMQWGGSVAHRKPDDWVRTVGFSYSAEEVGAAVDVRDEGGFWIARPGRLYVRYVSKAAERGLSLGDWPESFTRYVAARLAADIAERIRPGTDRLQLLHEIAKRELFNAQNRDASDEGGKTIPLGRLARARAGGSIVGRERG